MPATEADVALVFDKAHLLGHPSVTLPFATNQDQSQLQRPFQKGRWHEPAAKRFESLSRSQFIGRRDSRKYFGCSDAQTGLSDPQRTGTNPQNPREALVSSPSTSSNGYTDHHEKTTAIAARVQC